MATLALDLDNIYNYWIVVTNTGQGRLCPMPPYSCRRHGHGATRATARSRPQPHESLAVQLSSSSS